MNTIEEKCLLTAYKLIISNKNPYNLDLIELTDLLIKLELEKIEKDNISDNCIDFNDEIISIEDVGELETIDIQVTGDNLFYCNNILTKNSYGLPFTTDFMCVIVENEDLRKLGQLVFKQLKNRFGSLDLYNKFVVGVDKSKMRLYNVDESAQDLVDSDGVFKHEKPVMDNTLFGETDFERAKKGKKFTKNLFDNFS